MNSEGKAFLYWLGLMAVLLLLALCFKGLGEGSAGAFVIPAALLLAMLGLIGFICVPKRK